MMNLAGAEMLIGAMCGAGISYLVPAFFKRTIGTRYVTEKECERCLLKREFQSLRRMVVQLAIKAGVPADEVADIVSKPE
jgi:hypothetical protein